MSSWRLGLVGLLLVGLCGCADSDPRAAALAFQKPYDRAVQEVRAAAQDTSNPEARERLRLAQQQADNIANEASGHFTDCRHPLKGYGIPVAD